MRKISRQKPIARGYKVKVGNVKGESAQEKAKIMKGDEKTE